MKGRTSIGRMALTFGRYTVALVMSVVMLPLLLPVLLQLPYGGITAKWYRVSLNALSVIAAVAAVNFQFLSPKDDLERDSLLHAPMVKVWTSVVGVKGGQKVVCRTIDQPGRWMDDAGLQNLQSWLRAVAKDSMGVVPTHALFDSRNGRDVMRNRVITIAFDNDKPVAFTAMVYIPFAGSSVLHLGLTMIAKTHRGLRLQSPIFTKCLVMPMFNMRRLGYYITNIAASPAGIGAVSDYFLDTFPSYRGDTKCTDVHLEIARYVLKNYRSDFACSDRALFNESTFVVHGSNDPDGGGAPEFIKEDGNPVSFYKDERCNDFCRKRLDYTAGDEQFQVARVDFVATSLKYLMSPVPKRRN